jgi:hypothetical protein
LFVRRFRGELLLPAVSLAASASVPPNSSVAALTVNGLEKIFPASRNAAIVKETALFAIVLCLLLFILVPLF